MSHGYTDETGYEWPYPCTGELGNTCCHTDHDESQAHDDEGDCPGYPSCDDPNHAPSLEYEPPPGFKHARYPRRLEGACGRYSTVRDCWDYCELATGHHGPHEFTGSRDPLPRPVRRRDLLEWAVLLTVALTAAYLFSQGVRFAIG